MNDFIIGCGKSLNKNQFANYFEKKILYTFRKFNLVDKKQGINLIKTDSINYFVLKYFLNKIGFNLSNKSKIIVLGDSSDDIADLFLKSFSKKNSKIYSELEKLKPKYLDKNNVFIRPLFLLTNQEIIHYSKLFNLGKNQKIMSEQSELLSYLSSKYPQSKLALIQSLLKITNCSP